MKKNKDKFESFNYESKKLANKLGEFLGKESNNNIQTVAAFALLMRFLCDQCGSEEPFQDFLTLFHGLSKSEGENEKK
jgi:hypothetical protein